MSNFKQLAHLDLAMSRPHVLQPSSYPAAAVSSNQPFVVVHIHTCCYTVSVACV